MAADLTIQLTDQDPANENPIQPHPWTVHLEFQPVGNEAGGSWSFDAPNELWAKTLYEAVVNLTDEQWSNLKSSPFQH